MKQMALIVLRPVELVAVLSICLPAIARGDGFDFSAPSIISFTIVNDPEDNREVIIAEHGHIKARTFRTVGSTSGGEQNIEIGLSHLMEGDTRRVRFVHVRYAFQPLAVFIERNPSEKIKANTLTFRIVPHSGQAAPDEAILWVGATESLANVQPPPSQPPSAGAAVDPHWEKCFTIRKGSDGKFETKFCSIQTKAKRGGRYVIVGIGTTNCALQIAEVGYMHPSVIVPDVDSEQTNPCTTVD